VTRGFESRHRCYKREGGLMAAESVPELIAHMRRMVDMIEKELRAMSAPSHQRTGWRRRDYVQYLLLPNWRSG
jgi:hypothetical protein